MTAPTRNSIELLANTPVRIEFGPYAIDATPLTVGELPQILHHAAPLMGELRDAGSAEDAARLFADHGEALIAITALAARLPVEQVRALDPDQAIELFVKLLELNADFFARRIIPAVNKALESMDRLGAGPAQIATQTGSTPPPI